MRIIKTVLLLLVLSLPAFAQQQEAGIVLSVSGDVRLESSGLGTSYPAAVKTIIYQDDVIVTGVNGRAQILFRDDTIMSLSPDTELALLDFDFTSTGSSFAAKIAKGVARVVTGEIVKRNPESFNISTPHATISIRGTTVTTLVLPSGTSAIVNDATLGKAVVMTTIATNEVLSTDITGMVLHANIDGAANIREASPEEMRLSQLVSPSLSLSSEVQGVDARNELNNNIADNNIIDIVAPIPVVDFTASYSGSFNPMVSGLMDTSTGVVSFNVDMSTGEMTNFLAQMALNDSALISVGSGGIDIVQGGPIFFDSAGNITPGDLAVNVIGGWGAVLNASDAYLSGSLAGNKDAIIRLIVEDFTNAVLADVNATLPCSGYCQ